MKNSQKGFATSLIIAIVALLIIGGSFYLIKSIPASDNNPGDQINTPNATTNDTKTVNLSGQGLKNIPPLVFSITETEKLDISNNSITGSIQAEIRFLSKLKVLNASNNLMTGLPAEIGQLTNLEVLDLSNNKLTGLPNEIGNLSNLKTLNLSGNQYSKQDLDYIRTKLPSSVNIIID
jgi:Leucine-rich repeat (LRR) protein